MKQELVEWYVALLFSCPGSIGRRLRRGFVRSRAKRAGRGMLVGAGTRLYGLRNIEFGEDVSIGERCTLNGTDGTLVMDDRSSINTNVRLDASAGGHIYIGPDTIIGPNVVVRASNHRTDNKELPVRNQGHRAGRIEIGEDVWIGANVVVTPDVKIGSHSVVAAGAVVTKDVPQWSVTGGVPAERIGER